MKRKNDKSSVSDIRKRFKKLMSSFPYNTEKKYEYCWVYKGFDILRLNSGLFIALIFGRITVLYVENECGNLTENYKMARNFHTFAAVCGIIDKICKDRKTESFERL